jgi:CheY-like chemotaxis protein
VAKAKILCIEDDSDMIEYLRLMLGEAGYEVIGALGGVEGLEMMRNEQPDLVLLDLMMPVLDGADVLLQKKQDPTIHDIPVIALTALDSNFEAMIWKARTEVKDFITKGTPESRRRELIARIERVLAGASGQPE